VFNVDALLEAKCRLEAIDVLQDHMGLVEQDFELSWNLGWPFFKQDDLARATLHLARAVSLAPARPVGHWALGIVLAEKGDFKKAEAAYLTSLTLKDSSLARLGLGYLYQQQGQLEEAENVHLEGIRLKPTDKERIEAYADFLSGVGRETEAQVQYERAAQVAGNEGTS
jgi:Flp pilus assembly protein TadD